MKEGGAVVIGIPVDTYVFVRAHAEKVMEDNGAERLTCSLADMPDRQTAMLTATKVMAQKTCFLKRGLNIDLSEDSCSRADQAELWILERVLENLRGRTKNIYSLTGAQVTASPPATPTGAGKAIHWSGRARAFRGFKTTIIGLDRQPRRNAAGDKGGHIEAIGERGLSALLTAPMIGALGEALRCLANDGRVPPAQKTMAISPALVR